ncbi:MAG: hypothetical protein OXC42_02535 [Gammaproteobacteria bacterium]|nr:hypothetical protein [Gammaproteobacteria bacterium]
MQLSDLMVSDRDEFQDGGNRRGVNTASWEGGDIVRGYGGWMDYSFFYLDVWNPVSDDPLRPSESTFTSVYSIGNASGSNPLSGSATWTGVMAGIDENEDATTFGNLVTGNATVTIDNFSTPRVGVALSSISDVATGKSHADIAWSGLSLNSGAFSASGLSGLFYGPNHEEVGGIFLRNQISGAFGAARQ